MKNLHLYNYLEVSGQIVRLLAHFNRHTAFRRSWQMLRCLRIEGRGDPVSTRPAAPFLPRPELTLTPCHAPVTLHISHLFIATLTMVTCDQRPRCHLCTCFRAAVPSLCGPRSGAPVGLCAWGPAVEPRGDASTGRFARPPPAVRPGCQQPTGWYRSAAWRWGTPARGHRKRHPQKSANLTDQYGARPGGSTHRPSPSPSPRLPRSPRHSPETGQRTTPQRRPRAPVKGRVPGPSLRIESETRRSWGDRRGLGFRRQEPRCEHGGTPRRRRSAPLRRTPRCGRAEGPAAWTEDRTGTAPDARAASRRGPNALGSDAGSRGGGRGRRGGRSGPRGPRRTPSSER